MGRRHLRIHLLDILRHKPQLWVMFLGQLRILKQHDAYSVFRQHAIRLCRLEILVYNAELQAVNEEFQPVGNVGVEDAGG